MIKTLNFVVALILMFSSSVRAELDILFVNPSLPNEPFWQSVEEITQSAALQFDTKLSVIYGMGNRIVQLETVKSYLAKNKKPNYAIVLNYPGGSHALMSLLDEHKIKFVTLEQTIFDEEREKIGLAGQHYKHWIGEIYFDNKQVNNLEEVKNNLQKEISAPLQLVDCAVDIRGVYCESA